MILGRRIALASKPAQAACLRAARGTARHAYNLAAWKRYKLGRTVVTVISAALACAGAVGEP
jgi:hypothetical protein